MRRHEIMDPTVRLNTRVTEFTARSFVMLLIYLTAVLNGTHSASLMFRWDAHWTIPYPLGTVVGPLTVTTCPEVTVGPL